MSEAQILAGMRNELIKLITTFNRDKYNLIFNAANTIRAFKELGTESQVKEIENLIKNVGGGLPELVNQREQESQNIVNLRGIPF